MIQVCMLMRMKKKMMKTMGHRHLKIHQDKQHQSHLKKRKIAVAESVLISEAASVLAEIKKKTTNPMLINQINVVPDDEDTLYCKYLAEILKK